MRGPGRIAAVAAAGLAIAVAAPVASAAPASEVALAAACQVRVMGVAGSISNQLESVNDAVAARCQVEDVIISIDGRIGVTIPEPGTFAGVSAVVAEGAEEVPELVVYRSEDGKVAAAQSLDGVEDTKYFGDEAAISKLVATRISSPVDSIPPVASPMGGWGDASLDALSATTARPANCTSRS